MVEFILHSGRQRVLSTLKSNLGYPKYVLTKFIANLEFYSKVLQVKCSVSISLVSINGVHYSNQLK